MIWGYHYFRKHQTCLYCVLPKRWNSGSWVPFNKMDLYPLLQGWFGCPNICRSDNYSKNWQLQTSKKPLSRRCTQFFHFKSNISSYTLDHGTFKSAFFFKENDLPNLHEEMFQPLIFRVWYFFASKMSCCKKWRLSAAKSSLLLDSYPANDPYHPWLPGIFTYMKTIKINHSSARSIPWACVAARLGGSWYVAPWSTTGLRTIGGVRQRKFGVATETWDGEC